MLLYDFQQIFGFHPDSSRIVIWMNAYQPRIFQKCFVQEKLHAAGFVIQKAKRRYRVPFFLRNSLRSTRLRPGTVIR